MTNGRKNFGFIYILSGRVTYTFNEDVYTFEEGDMVFLKEGNEQYYIDSTPGIENLALNFTVDRNSSSGEITEHIINNPHPVSISNDKAGKYRSLMEKAINAVNKNYFGAKMIAVSVCYEILQDFLYDMMFKSIKSKEYNRILPAKVYIDENFYKEISVVELANRCNMCETNFRRNFTSVFGISPRGYINSVRVNNAKSFFSSGAYSVSEVAELCGFSDTNYFCRFFKKNTGMTPLEYKNSVYE